MNMNNIFEKISSKLNIGKIIEEPSRVDGGLTHKMYKLFTDKDKYIIKLLNPNIMKRETALTNYETADQIEEILKENNINAKNK